MWSYFKEDANSIIRQSPLQYAVERNLMEFFGLLISYPWIHRNSELVQFNDLFDCKTKKSPLCSPEQVSNNVIGYDVKSKYCYLNTLIYEY